MTPKFSKLEEKVEELYINNIPINTISNITKKPKSSIYNAIRRIKDKKQNKNIKTLDLKKTQNKPIKKIQNREKRIINRDFIKNLKVQNNELLLINNLDFSKRTLQRFLKEEGYSCNTSFKKAYLDKIKKKAFFPR